MFRPGEKFERYRIDALLGEGGMGLVYRAYDTHMRRNVALKVVRPELARLPGRDALTEPAQRLIREGRAAAALNHPNAVHIFAVGELSRVPYIAMELVVGKPMSELIEDTSVSLRTRIQWLIAVANGLGAAHKQGLVHRDVKPDNVMVCDDGSVKVLDFGVAKAIKDMPTPAGIHDSFVTRAGVVMGTPLYMAPEQVIGEKLDGRSDQFSWGAMGYELLSGGVHPVRTNNPRQLPLAFAILQEMPRSLRKVAPHVTEDLSSVIMKALSKSPDDRFTAMEDIADALRPIAARASNAPLDPFEEPTIVIAERRPKSVPPPPPPAPPSEPKFFMRVRGTVTEVSTLRAATRRPPNLLSWAALAILVFFSAITANWALKRAMGPFRRATPGRH